MLFMCPSPIRTLWVKKYMLLRIIIFLPFLFFMTTCHPNDAGENQGAFSIPSFLSSLDNESNLSYDIREVKDSTSYQKAYVETKNQILEKRNIFRNQQSRGILNLKEVENYFLSAMRDSIFPYWYGTPWDFNGHTDLPREDHVACGYFVSTPLKHIGLNVNRFKLAQQGATNIMKSLCNGRDFFRTTSLEKLDQYLNEQNKEGLYVIGLSFHVGFISRENGKNYFIHSSYLDPVAVCKEELVHSPAIKSSEDYILGELSMNTTFLKKWVSGSRVVVVQ